MASKTLIRYKDSDGNDCVKSTIRFNSQTTYKQIIEWVETWLSGSFAFNLKIKDPSIDEEVDFDEDYMEEQNPYINHSTTSIIRLRVLQTSGDRHRNSVVNHYQQVSNQTQNQEFLTPGAYEEAPCKGRLCSKCRKCRDWYYTGDAAKWDWIRNTKEWKHEDWSRYNKNKCYEGFKRRDGATCCYPNAFGGDYYNRPACGPAPGYPNQFDGYACSYCYKRGDGMHGDGYCCGGCNRCHLSCYDHCFYHDNDYTNGFECCYALCLCKDNIKN